MNKYSLDHRKSVRSLLLTLTLRGGGQSESDAYFETNEITIVPP